MKIQQIAVDGKENVIVACRLTDEATDHYQLKPLAEATKENVGTPQNWGADAGVFSYENAEYQQYSCETAILL